MDSGKIDEAVNALAEAVTKEAKSGTYGLDECARALAEVMRMRTENRQDVDGLAEAVSKKIEAMTSRKSAVILAEGESMGEKERRMAEKKAAVKIVVKTDGTKEDIGETLNALDEFVNLHPGLAIKAEIHDCTL